MSTVGEWQQRFHREDRLRASSEIFGSRPFDGAMAQKGYALNKMCFGERAGARRFRRLRNRQWRRRSQMTKTSQKAIQT